MESRCDERALLARVCGNSATIMWQIYASIIFSELMALLEFFNADFSV
jgi:hypothetical protein